ncbi:MAG: glycosyltransferase [Anaerolineales bacterium]|jgi:D-inositol-3-phosphate glycosyltransferase
MEKKLRVAMLSYHTCPLATLGGKDTGGMNVYVRELSRILGSMGVHVDVYTRSQDEHVPHVVHDLGYGNRVVHILSGPELPLLKKELAEFIPTFVDNIIEFTDKKNLQYDIIHGHYWMSGIAGGSLKEAWNVPMVQMLHTLGLMKNRIAGEGEYEGDYRIRGELEVLRKADMVVAATQAELAQLQWLYEVKTDHVRVIPPGVNLRRFNPIPVDEAREYIHAPLEKRMLLFVGRIEPLKGIDTLLRALARLKNLGVLKCHNLCLSVIGGDASVSESQMSQEMIRLNKLRDELGVKDLVTFLGKKDQGTLPYYYSAADIVVVPSHYESFGMVALEAMACGTPVVASQVGGLAYLIQDGVTGFHVPDQDPVALSEQLLVILNDDDLYHRMSIQAAEYAKGFSWQIVAQQIVALYHEVIGEYKN